MYFIVGANIYLLIGECLKCQFVNELFSCRESFCYLNLELFIQIK